MGMKTDHAVSIPILLAALRDESTQVTHELCSYLQDRHLEDVWRSYVAEVEELASSNDDYVARFAKSLLKKIQPTDDAGE